jgi:HPt (histidine-containing phosphotransfer) domain-containing protein
MASADASRSAARYWGVISVVADLELFMRAAGLTDQPSMRLAVFQLQPHRQTIRAPIWGDPALATLATAVHQSVQLPGATWSIAAAPSAAQGRKSTAYGLEFFASLAGSAALSGVAALAVSRRRLLQQQNRTLAQQIEQSLRTQAELEAAQSRFKSLTELGLGAGREFPIHVHLTCHGRGNASQQPSIARAQALGVTRFGARHRLGRTYRSS